MIKKDACLPKSRFSCVRQPVCVLVCFVDVMSQVRAHSLERVNAFEPFASPLLTSKPGLWRHLKNKNVTAPAHFYLFIYLFVYFVGCFPDQTEFDCIV